MEMNLSWGIYQWDLKWNIELKEQHRWVLLRLTMIFYICHTET